MGELMAFLAGFMLFGLCIVFVFYILMALGLMKMADKLGLEGTWMAWVPLCNSYLIGKMAISKAVGWILVGVTLLTGSYLSSGVGGAVEIKLLPESLENIVSIGMFILLVVCFHKIYKKFSTKAVVMTVFTVLSLGLLAPIFMFAIRNNPVNE